MLGNRLAFSRIWKPRKASSVPTLAFREVSQSPKANVHNCQVQSRTISSSRLIRNPLVHRSPIRSRHVQTIRAFSATAAASHGDLTPPKPGEEIHVTIVDKEGVEYNYEVAKGDNLLDIAQGNDLEMEGACGGSCACSTCHVIVEDYDMFDKMPEADDDENDMLDLAFGLKETSRLGCQVKMTKELDGLKVRLPAMTRNLQASDFVEKKKS